MKLSVKKEKDKVIIIAKNDFKSSVYLYTNNGLLFRWKRGRGRTKYYL